MKIIMLGWEYPPHIAGGLGTACEGLTRGLARLGVDITFVVPQLYGGEDADHMRIMDPILINQPVSNRFLKQAREEVLAHAAEMVLRTDYTETKRVRIPSQLLPYLNEADYDEFVHVLRQAEERVRTLGEESETVSETIQVLERPQPAGRHYGHDIFEEVSIYTRRVVAKAPEFDGDAIHAHDWMTYPSGVALKEYLGIPLVVHVHSLEYDRSGTHVNPRIHQIESLGLHAADAVIAVSQYTKGVINREYGVPMERIHVVHNGIYPPKAVRHYKKHSDLPAKVVLYLGRITFQKGPDYFVRAAAKVIPHVPDVAFVMAGSGDMQERMEHLVEQLGIREHFRFTGFLKDKEVEEMFSVAKLYVMPSVSEPFGISALEAINFDIPALISRQSGVSEVIGNTLKFDFWDVDRLADLIINGLLHDELRDDMIAMAREELKNLRWDASAIKTVDVYNKVLN